MQQEHRTVEETYVPEPRSSDHDDDVAVGTAQADGRHDPDHDDADESYPAGTYASGSATDLDGRDAVEVVDHDRALADERAEDAAGERDVPAPRIDEDVREETAREDEARAGDDTDEPDAVAVGERDEVETAQAEAAEDQTWQAGHTGHTDRADDGERIGDAEDRAWAAEHATELRAGSVDADPAGTQTLAADRGDETLAVSEPADEQYADGRYTADDSYTSDAAARNEDEPNSVPVPATIENRSDVYHSAADTAAGEAASDDADADAAAQAGEAVDGDEVIVVPVDAAADTPAEVAESGQDLRPGAVEPVPIGAIWAEGTAEGLRDRWRELQLRFIDDPSSVAGEADDLVGEAVAAVTASLDAQRQQLSAWRNDGIDDTEQLRSAVRQYRDFFNRLLGM